ncbi:MAG: hypothetical protein K2N48_07770 [Muribaculaceae bacterium]|nr:hypothetical protein [Muribaculaceae bacterium]
MKKLLLYSFAALLSASAFAELPSDGYYRVQNAYTKRYVYLMDNKGSINGTSTTVDVGALELYKDLSELNTDPSDIFYIQKAASGKYSFDVYGQGTSVHGFLNRYLEIIEDRKPYEGRTSYMLHGTDMGVSKYVGDLWKNMDDNKGLASSECVGDDRKWYFDSVDASTDQYFGIAPSQESNGKYFYPLYAGFPISAYSSGIKFYAVEEIDSRGAAVINEIKGIVPAGVPVIVECSSPYATDNRLNVGPFGGGDNVKTNLLKGVYFDNNERDHHWNRTRFDKNTMRVLGVKDGRLAFVESDIEYLPRNQAYLQLTDASQYGVKDFIVMTEEQREAELGSVSIVPDTAVVDVYTVDGRLVNAGVAKDEVRLLGKGLYILRGAGVSEKLIVR